MNVQSTASRFEPATATPSAKPGDELGPFPWTRLFITGIVVVLFVALVRPGATLEQLSKRSQPSRRVLDLHAVKDGSAIILWEEARGTHWITRVGVDGERWERAIPGAARYIGVDKKGIAVSNDLVVVQYVHSERLSFDLLGVDLASGSIRWSVFVEPPHLREGRHERDPIAARMYVASDDILVATSAGWLRIDSTTARTSVVYPGETQFSTISGGVVRERFRSRVVGPDLVDRGVGCKLSTGTFDVLTMPGDSVTLRRTTGPLVADVVVPSVGVARACAEYRGNVVVFSEWKDTLARIHVVNPDGDMLDRIEVPGRMNWYRWDRDGDPLAGVLPRFMLVEAWNANDQIHLVDLERGTIVRTTMDADLASVVRAGDRWIQQWWKWRGSRALEVVDATTGISLGLISTSLAVEVRNHHAGGGYLWLADRDDDELAYARIELATLRVDVRRGPMRVGYEKADRP